MMSKWLLFIRTAIKKAKVTRETSDKATQASSYNDESEPAVKGETLSKILEEIVDAISNHKHIP